MPRFDRTGPEGMGPMTGRGMGYCAGFTPAYPRRGGFNRMGMAFRHGWRRWHRPGWDWAPENEPEDEISWLQQEERFLQKQLNALQERLKSLEQKPE